MSYLNRYLSKTSESERDSAAIAYLAALDHIQKENPEVAFGIVNELHDQRRRLKLFAS
ncbi:MAG: glycine hydroxymethyltransferase, partial [Simkaniaceae bacterium]|nr:glycine hydroxymethyltransferase [Simkaniaceae bacterium]